MTSDLWDLGTTGVAETTGPNVVTLLAGFDTRQAAERADHELALRGEIEPVAAAWGDSQVHQVEIEGHEPAIEIVAAESFGHGAHPTTRHVLDRLPALVTPESSVLDLGTGSGVLAIAASLLGAAQVLGIDIAAEACDAALGNAERNGVSIAVRNCAMTEVDGSFSLIMANVLLPVHIALADEVARCLGPGGRLVISGILREQLGDASAAYAQHGLSMIESGGADDDDGWVSAVFATGQP